MRSLVSFTVRSSRLSNHRARRFVSRHPVLLIALVLMAALLAINAGSLNTSASQGPGARRAAGTQPAPPAGPKQGAQSVAGVLNEDGSVKPGVNGSFDVSGFRMDYAPGGAPRFVPAPMLAGGCAADWDTQFGLANGVGDTVVALAVIGSDLYVGGLFTRAGNVVANHVAKFDTTTGTWSALGSGNGVNGPVYALAVIGSDLYIGGSFTSNGSTTVPAGRVAKFDTTTGAWSALGSGGGNGVNSDVAALAVIGSDLYVGGYFTTANVGRSSTVPANRVAKFDTTTGAWSALGSGDGNGVNSFVRALAVIGSNLFVGGDFSTANVGGSSTVPANRVAKFDTTAGSWSALGSGGGNGVNSLVRELAVIGSNLFVGGDFSTANVGGSSTVPANRVAKFDTTTGTWSGLGSGGGNGVGGDVYALAVIGSNLFVGGNFSTANVGGSSTVPANRVAKFDTTTGTWSGLGSGGGNGVNSAGVDALAVIGSDLYVGGTFTTAGNVPAYRVARFDTTTGTWSALGSGGGNGVVGDVYALAVSGSDLYVGGYFYAAGNVPANHVAKFDTTTGTWSALGSGGGNGVSSDVYALAVIGSNLFVGGDFSTANVGGSTTVPVNRVAKFDTTTGAWSALGSGGGNGVSSPPSAFFGMTVYALAVIGSDLYVGGNFSTANVGGSSTVPANRVAKFDTTTGTWSGLGSGGGNGVGGDVYALAVSGSNLYVGGTFTTAGNVPAYRVARFDTTTGTWSALGSGGGNGVSYVDPFSLKDKAEVDALVVIGSDLYVGGAFTTAFGGSRSVPANNIARVHTTTGIWDSLGLGVSNGVSGPVYALAVIGSDLYVGGYFSAAGNLAVDRVAKFDTTFPAFRALGSGLGNGAVKDPVRALAVIGSDLYVGGLFATAGGGASSHLARWFVNNAPPTLTFGNQAVAINGSLNINPATGPADDGTVSTLAVQSPGTYTGSISVNNTTGVVSISNAAPLGTHNLTIRATDNCGAITDASFMVTVNKAATQTTVSSSVNPSGVSQSVIFTATVTSAAGTPTGTVQFKIDGTNSGGLVTLNGSGTAQLMTSSLTVGPHTIAADYSGDPNFVAGTGTLAGGQTVNNRPLISLSLSNYNVIESDGAVTVTVNRTGDLSVPVTVDYATDDTGAPIPCAPVSGNTLASSRCDFGLTWGTLKFAATETQKTFAIPISQDAHNEGPEMFTVNLSNLTGTGAAFATPASATVTISDSAAPAPNASDDTDAFVRQQYRDFLNREADAAGLAFWTNEINSCGSDATCRDIKRINVSAAFFLSIEFQQTGILVRNFYVAALDRPLTNNMPGFVEFERDTQAVQRGVIVGQGNWQQTLNNNRDAFMNDFVTRAEFVGLYPTTDTPAQYVDKLYQHAGVSPGSAQERSDAIAEFGAATTAADAGARGRALLRITQNASFQQREINPGFVQMEYFGYLRRNPNDAPDGNFAGYNFWLNKLNQFNGNFIQAEMVKAFLVSGEYRRRFGP